MSGGKATWSPSRILHQDEKWEPAEGPPVMIMELSLDYARNILRWLDKRADRAKEAVISQLLFYILDDLPDGAWNALQDEVSQLEGMDAKIWIRTTPLYQRIQAHINQNRGPDE